MLGKLFRNEMKCTGKTMLLIFALTIASTTMGCILLGVDTVRMGHVGNILEMIFVLTYIFAIIFLFLGTFIYACHRFYKSMFSDQGYLTHTLPVSSLANLNVRIITSIIWILLSGVMMLLSVFALLVSSSKGEFLRELGRLDYKMLNEIFVQVFGYGIGVCFAVTLLLILVSCLSMLLLAYAAFSLGQLSNRHKVGSAIGWGIGLYFIQQIISSIVLAGMTDNIYIEETEFEIVTAEGATAVYTSADFPHEIIWMAIGVCAFFALVEYIICAVIVKKRVNLE